MKTIRMEKPAHSFFPRSSLVLSSIKPKFKISLTIMMVLLCLKNVWIKRDCVNIMWSAEGVIIIGIREKRVVKHARLFLDRLQFFLASFRYSWKWRRERHQYSYVREKYSTITSPFFIFIVNEYCWTHTFINRYSNQSPSLFVYIQRIMHIV